MTKATTSAPLVVSRCDCYSDLVCVEIQSRICLISKFGDRSRTMAQVERWPVRRGYCAGWWKTSMKMWTKLLDFFFFFVHDVSGFLSMCRRWIPHVISSEPTPLVRPLLFLFYKFGLVLVLFATKVRFWFFFSYFFLINLNRDFSFSLFIFFIDFKIVRVGENIGISVVFDLRVCGEREKSII